MSTHLYGRPTDRLRSDDAAALRALTDVLRRHRLVIYGCGCCGSPCLDTEDGRALADYVAVFHDVADLPEVNCDGARELALSDDAPRVTWGPECGPGGIPIGWIDARGSGAGDGADGRGGEQVAMQPGDMVEVVSDQAGEGHVRVLERMTDVDLARVVMRLRDRRDEAHRRYTEAVREMTRRRSAPGWDANGSPVE